MACTGTRLLSILNCIKAEKVKVIMGGGAGGHNFHKQAGLSTYIFLENVN
jgi:hypothetical protein